MTFKRLIMICSFSFILPIAIVFISQLLNLTFHILENTDSEWIVTVGEVAEWDPNTKLYSLKNWSSEMSPLAALIHPLNWSFKLFFRTSCYVAQSPFRYDGIGNVALIVCRLECIQRLRVIPLFWITITILYKFDRRPHSFFFLSSKLEKASTYAGSDAMCHLPRSDSVRLVFAKLYINTAQCTMS